MSFNRLPYDTCAYKQTLAQTIGPGEYQINEPYVSCEPCFVSDPHIRLQKIGSSFSRTTAMIDIDSELMGITRRQSKCPERKYLPECGADNQCGANGGKGSSVQNSAVRMDYDLVHLPDKDCFPAVQDTRLSNPPCTLRETGWNRFEWHCKNPQERVTIPFDYNIDSKLMTKDNHRPCIPVPMDQYGAWPTESNEPLCDAKTVSVCSPPTEPVSVMLAPLDQVKNL